MMRDSRSSGDFYEDDGETQEAKGRGKGSGLESDTAADPHDSDSDGWNDSDFGPHGGNGPPPLLTQEEVDAIDADTANGDQPMPFSISGALNTQNANGGPRFRCQMCGAEAGARCSQAACSSKATHSW